MGEVMNRLFDVMSSIVTVALVAVIVQSPHTSQVIKAFGDAFSGAINAAQRI